jgi:Arc/MetJ-type ribon-helix-helix transcriptional regulator
MVGKIKNAKNLETAQIRLTPRHIKAIDILVREGHYPSRSEAIRHFVKNGVEKNGRRKK